MSTKQKKAYLDAIFRHFTALGVQLTDPEMMGLEAMRQESSMTISASTEQLRELLARVSEGDGPDREIDGAIAVVLHDLKPTIQSWVKANFPEWSSDSTGRVFGIDEDGSLGPNWLSDHYTASVDASLALVERVLPGWLYLLDDHSGFFLCCLDLADADGTWIEDVSAEAATAPLAIVAATLKAIISASERAIQS